MAEPISVSLPDHWLVYLQGLVENRRFESMDEAIASGIRLLEADEHEADHLARLLDEGERDGGFEEWDYDKFKAEMRHRGDDRQAA